MTIPWPTTIPEEVAAEISLVLSDIYDRYEREPELEDLRKGATQLVAGAGDMHPPVVFVGEAPGADEDQDGRPFVGRSGQKLDELLSEIGIDRRLHHYTTNAVKYRPEGNRTPYRWEVAASRPYLLLELDHLQPLVVVTLGASALLALDDDGSRRITEVHGQPMVRDDGIVHLPTFHPSAALRYRDKEELMRQDLWQLAGLLDSVGVLR